MRESESVKGLVHLEHCLKLNKKKCLKTKRLHFDEAEALLGDS